MTVIRVICKNCGRYLGTYSQPHFGMDDMEAQIQHDPDCQYCNPYYYLACKTCGQKNIDYRGVCRSCKSENSLEASK